MEKLLELGAKPVTLSDSSGYIYDEEGIDSEKLAFVMDLKKLSKLIKTKVIDKLDHKNLNLDVDFMKGKLTSCEVLIEEIWNILAPEIAKEGNAKLYRLLLFETINNSVEYYGPDFKAANLPVL